jgi:16S rRNA (uracil1498-N3)-methyltransferase
MRRFFLPDAIEASSLIQLSGQDARHISQVLRLRPGDVIEVAGLSGRVGVARIERVDNEHVNAYVESLKTGGAEPPVSLILAQGLPKADKMEFIIQKAVELGVGTIAPMVCEHSVVRYDAIKAAGRVERWQSIAREASKQSKRDSIPAVAPIRTLKQVLQECPGDTIILMLYEGKAPVCLRQVLRQPQAASYLLLVGPEGGFSPAEVELCQQFGGQSVTLGPRILRTETASLAAVSIILYEFGDLGGLPCRE